MSGDLLEFGGEAAIRSQAQRTLVTLFDSLYEGAVVIDRAGRVVWMNDKYKALIGWNGLERLEGRPVEEVLPESQMRRVVESGKADLLDIFRIGERDMVVSRLPLFDDGGTVTGALGVILYDRIQALRPIVTRFQTMQRDLNRARKELAEQRRAKYSFSQFVGASRTVIELKARARRAAASEATVLLLGETGTGKELLAHAIHATSPRAAGPMVRVNAAAIPEALLEAELFGAAPGAYTGAAKGGRVGKFQLADRGTLFLDEVGDMPLSLQVKLLRVLEEKELEALGSDRLVPVDVRVIAATSRDLPAMVEAGAFRADLFYRLNVLPLEIPPLRERLEDLPLLCESLLERQSHESGQPQKDIAAAALVRLAGHDWPGNVRELANILQQATAMNESPTLRVAHFEPLLPEQGDAGRGGAAQPFRPLRARLAEAEATIIAEALAASGGVKTRAAKLLGISRAQLYEKLAAYHMLSGDPDSSADVRKSGQHEKRNQNSLLRRFRA
ncbi:sigma-54 interaction domain-containing protein [Oceanibacterium hippocampi]|uniref:Limonene hydroxylase n=1 Tax=Oceanibacterium hippocampi TaxID=745714 RepID=A0A1Y5SW31_9PROT|nr:sigma 54-interacting transcriptional regulator [Oceanibacterium hippocampi]SLN49701.1 Limonene hydroxylase [Oceanibacterium hippocampi]